MTPSPPPSQLLGPDLGPVAHRTLPDALLAAATEDADQLWLSFPDRLGGPVSYTYAEVWQQALRWAGHVAAAGVEVDQTVLLALPTGPDFVFAFFGIQLAGAVPVPWPELALASETGRAHRIRAVGRVARDCSARCIILEDGELYGTAGGSLLTIEPPGDEVVPGGRRPTAATALIQYTSGPTSSPTGAMLTHDRVLANVHGLGRSIGFGRDHRGLSWLPLFQDMGLVGCLFSSLYFRYPMFFTRVEGFLLRPHAWLQAVQEHRITVTATPNFAFALCNRRVRPRHLEGLDLSTWRVALNGAEVIDPATVRAFEELLEPCGVSPGLVTAAYGLAENSLVATFGREGVREQSLCLNAQALERGRVQVDPDGVEVASVGHAIHGQRVAILEPSGTLAAPGCVGEVAIRGPSTMAGYRGADARSEHTLRGGWLHTGDEGFVYGDALYITGRIKRMVIKRGRNLYCDDIEIWAAEHLGIPVACVSAQSVRNTREGTDDLRLVVQHQPADAVVARRALVVAMSAELGVQPGEVVWLSTASRSG